VFPALQRVNVTIITSNGKRFSKQLDYPKGDARNPLSDREVEEKFAALAEGALTKPRQRRVFDTIWNLEKAGSITTLMELLKSEQSPAAHG
jgi:2-methylcitrate dehydratase